MKEVGSKNIVEGNLDKATAAFFPKSGEWSSFCFQQDEHIDKINLPCHLRDINWLASCLKEDQDITMIDYKGIVEYVQHSAFFKKQRKAYELEIIKWQIEWMKSGGGRWLADETYGGDFALLSSDCDLAFRKGVVDTLTAIGMEETVVEEGLERFASLWRETYMESAFRHQYDFFFDMMPEENKANAPKFDIEHLNAWLRLRRYEYYQSHKESVENYGEVTPDMLMTEEEAEALREYVSMASAIRLSEMETYRAQVKTSDKKLAKI